MLEIRGEMLEALVSLEAVAPLESLANSSEESNETSEEPNHKSEEFFLSSRGDEKKLRRSLRLPPQL